jgi:hypothetical protein
MTLPPARGCSKGVEISPGAQGIGRQDVIEARLATGRGATQTPPRTSHSRSSIHNMLRLRRPDDSTAISAARITMQ